MKENQEKNNVKKHSKKAKTKAVKPNPKFNFDRSDLISVLAVLLSLGAFGVSIIQANIMKSQQQIMLSQQKSAVLPYLINQRNISSIEVDGNKLMTFDFIIENKGFGPAIIDSIIIEYNGKNYPDGSKLLLAILSESDAVSISNVHVGSLTDVFISPKEKFTLLKIEIKQEENQKIKFLKNAKIEYIFCSILDDCWEYKDGKTIKN